MFYVEDTQTHKQESLGTRDRAEATALLNDRNEAARQPQLNLSIVKAYLAGTDSGVSTRTWQHAFDAIIANKRGSIKERWERGSRQSAFDLIRQLVIIETQADHLLACMKAGTVVFQNSGRRRSVFNFLGLAGETRRQIHPCASVWQLGAKINERRILFRQRSVIRRVPPAYSPQVPPDASQ